MFNKIKNNDFFKYVTYVLLFFVVIFSLLFILKKTNVIDFFVVIEKKTFDFRQNLILNKNFLFKGKKANKDIVVVAIDNASYEHLIDRYGEWPIKRDIYADFVYYIEKQEPSVIAFDLLFIKSLKSSIVGDKRLAESIRSFDNVFTAMNFDNQDAKVRTPEKLPNFLTASIISSKPNIKFQSYPNCRTILPYIYETTPNVGFINAAREEDGVTRQFPLFMQYQNSFYPHLSLKVAQKYLEKTENLKVSIYEIDKYGNLLLGKRKIPIDAETGSVTFNWYGDSKLGKTSPFTYVPFYEVVEAMYSPNKNTQKRMYEKFHNKIIYVGTSVEALGDIKSSPTDKEFPGVEIHATFINNVIDNNFINKIPKKADVAITVLLALLVGVIVLKVKNVYVASTSVLLILFAYVVLSAVLMDRCNLWIGLVLPVAFAFISFIGSYIFKYLMKSKDFEYTYKLATTDGLTELYNHRYFQEQMIMNIENCKRYERKFSLILIDIDFFKKFNDNYGHQSGDQVLRQVAAILKKNVRNTDIVCRYGGEEMSIILTSTANPEAIITAQKICDAVSSTPFKLIGNVEKNVTISLGVSTFPDNGSSPSELIEYADKCLYKAKENGRNQVGKMD